ncbi:hypothetical protein Ntsu_55900 [Nocardia sp. IFM 10818]
MAFRDRGFELSFRGVIRCRRRHRKRRCDSHCHTQNRGCGDGGGYAMTREKIAKSHALIPHSKNNYKRTDRLPTDRSTSHGERRSWTLECYNGAIAGASRIR